MTPAGPASASVQTEELRTKIASTPELMAASDKPDGWNWRDMFIFQAHLDRSKEGVARRSPALATIQEDADKKRAKGSKAGDLRSRLANAWTLKSAAARKKVIEDDEYVDFVRQTGQPNDVPLYRGITSGGLWNYNIPDKDNAPLQAVIKLMKVQPGDTFESRLSAFTENESWARNFARDPDSGNYYGPQTGVVFRLAPGKGRAVPLADVSRSAAEQEWVASGKFRVTGVTEMNRATVGNNTKPFRIIDIEMIDDEIDTEAPTT